MAKITNPTTFAEHFGVDSDKMTSLGILNPTLAVDTKLFLDPLLLEHSKHKEIREDGAQQYISHFETIIKLLEASTNEGDVAWRNAARLFQFHEIKATCLGYGAASIGGSAFGQKLILHVMRTGKEIVDLGVRDPDLFVALALFEEGIGPDRISDMTTHVIIDALLKFNQRILNELSVAQSEFNLIRQKVHLAKNPFESKPTPVLLIPIDILRKLPLATDWDEVADAASKNAAMRARVNHHISHLWSAKTKRDKRKFREQALADAEAFKALLDVLHSANLKPYDVVSDPEGLRRWAEIAKSFAKKYPLSLHVPDKLDLAGVYRIVQQIVTQFRQLVENNGLVKSVWIGKDHLPEQYSQRLFFAVAYSYCKTNNLEISPEADSGRGPVDFKVSKGFDSRVLVEVKLSTNPKLVQGYLKQLETYKAAEETVRAIYLVMDIGSMGRKDKRLYELRNAALGTRDPVSDIEIIDAIPKPSASKL